MHSFIHIGDEGPGGKAATCVLPDLLGCEREVVVCLQEITGTSFFFFFCRDWKCAHQRREPGNSLHVTARESSFTANQRKNRNSHWHSLKINGKHCLFVVAFFLRRRETYRNLQSWKSMIKSRSVSLNMAKRAARSGLRVHHLRLAYRLDGFTGVYLILKQRTADGTARVTSTPRFLEQISSYIATYPDDDRYENHDEYQNTFGDDFEDGGDGSYEG